MKFKSLRKIINLKLYIIFNFYLNDLTLKSFIILKIINKVLYVDKELYKSDDLEFNCMINNKKK